ncbi:MAG: hypothetical protein F4060_11400 [Holophagales bacterium]|nr:hypothetical protein [Holophagales bacterium]
MARCAAPLQADALHVDTLSRSGFAAVERLQLQAVSPRPLPEASAYGVRRAKQHPAREAAENCFFYFLCRGAVAWEVARPGCIRPPESRGDQGDGAEAAGGS